MDDSIEKKKTDSVEFIRVIDRKAEKRRQVIQTIQKEKGEQRKRRSFVKMPNDVKTLTKVNRRLSRGRGERKPTQQNNVGYKFNPTKKPVFNFGQEVRFTARAKRPIVIDGSNVAMSHGNNKVFSVKGIEIVVRYFEGRGHQKIVGELD